MAAADLIFDPDVLSAAPLCEFQGWRAVERHGGRAVLPWRAEWLQARAAGVEAAAGADAMADELSDTSEDASAGQSVGECLVHLQKSRAATWRDLADAWTMLEPGGRLLLAGGNELGIVSAVKRLAKELGQSPRILSNRAHARIVLFTRDTGAGPVVPETNAIEMIGPDGAPHALATEPGVFSARRLDPGTQLLLDALADLPESRRVLDVGCGIGPIALSALLRWPLARAHGLDADARAIESARANARALGLEARCQFDWWDAAEPAPEGPFDLLLSNPPFHTHKAVDLDPARAMFGLMESALSKGGRALVVANRKLPYERDLSELGRVEILEQKSGYKLLAVRRLSRSSSSKRRHSPDARSPGRS